MALILGTYGSDILIGGIGADRVCRGHGGATPDPCPTTGSLGCDSDGAGGAYRIALPDTTRVLDVANIPPV